MYPWLLGYRGGAGAHPGVRPSPEGVLLAPRYGAYTPSTSEGMGQVAYKAWAKRRIFGLSAPLNRKGVLGSLGIAAVQHLCASWPRAAPCGYYPPYPLPTHNPH